MCAKMPVFIHYLFADIIYMVLRYVVRYRYRTVNSNLETSFPSLSQKDRCQLINKFYHHEADLIVESIYHFSISKESLMKRMKFEGVERVEESINQGRSVALFLGHYCNWEWISSLPLWLSDKSRSLQLYHPLENPVFDHLIGYTRERMGSTNIPMAQSIRHIMKYRNEGKPVVVGFIGDQVPIWESLNYWVDFLNHDTPVMTGGERIARKMGMDCYYVHIRKEKRGHYVAAFHLITDKVKETPEHYVTEQYYARLEENIKQYPEYWLWTHNRWKRSRQGFIDHLIREQRWYELDNLRFFDHAHPEGQPAADVDPDIENKKQKGGYKKE